MSATISEGTTAFPPQATTLTDLLSDSVRRHPRRPAVSDHVQLLDYAELDRRSDALGALIRSRGVSPGDRVGVCLPRSSDLVVAILGVLKAGGMYLAVDVDYPESRRDHLLRVAGAALVLTDAARAASFHVPTALVSDRAAFDGQSTGWVARPESPAALVFTSGSTGRPKGIVLEHRNIAWYASNPSLPRLRPEDRVAQTLSVSFDAFHHELWCTLAAGAELRVLPPAADLLAAGFAGALRAHEISVMAVPAMLVNHLVREEPDAFAPLRILGSGGDVLLASACRSVLNSAFDGDLFNMYGPAEATTSSTVHRVTMDDLRTGVVPIGTELAGATIRLLDAELREVATGEIGEIFIAGPGLARGYLDEPGPTAERYPTLPGSDGPERMYRTGDLARRSADGTLWFVGRVDRQVKVRGFRVEPGEVEQTLLRYPAVRDAAVLADGEGSDRRLVAFVVLAGRRELDEVRALAEQDLPHFMVPSEFVLADELPFTDHGKRDTAALRSMLAQHVADAVASQQPTTESERYLVGLWQELLGVDRVGRSDDFYTLGGHSLLAYRMSHRISEELAVPCEFTMVLDTPVLSDLAAALDDTHPDAP